MHCTETFCCIHVRLWFVSDIFGYGVTSQQRSSTETVPSEIGYMNVIPKCIDCSGKYPHYENLPETYAAINVYLAANPLEGWQLMRVSVISFKLLQFAVNIF